MGDSFTRGFGVNDAEVFPRILESRLQRTEVVNLGVSAYGLSQEFDYLKIEGVLHQPNILILAFCQNDIPRDRRSPEEQYRSRANPPPKSAPSGVLGPMKTWLSSHIVLFQLAQQAINTYRSLVKTLVAVGLKEELDGYVDLDDNIKALLRTYPPDLQADFEADEAELLQMRDWLPERGIRFIVVLIPALQAIEPLAFQHTIAYTVFESLDFDLEKPYRNLEAFASANSIEVVNTYPALKRRADAGAKLYLRSDPHFNALGHEVFAAEIFAYLKQPQ